MKQCTSRARRLYVRRRRREMIGRWVMGVDLGVEPGDWSASVIARLHLDTGVFEVVDARAFRFDPTAYPTPYPTVIEGSAVTVETDPARLLDAGGSEP